MPGQTCAHLLPCHSDSMSLLFAALWTDPQLTLSSSSLHCFCICIIICHLCSTMSPMTCKCRSATQWLHRPCKTVIGLGLVHNSNAPTQAAPEAAPSKDMPPDCQMSLAAMPATALASIFHHLNSTAAFKLAQTCRTCATEFAHQRKEFTRKAWNELVPSVTCDPQQARSSATHLENTLLIHMKWEQNPGSALRRLYAISQHPGNVDPVKEMWKQAWPKTLWSDLLCDGMPETCSCAHHSGPLQVVLYINVAMQVMSSSSCHGTG